MKFSFSYILLASVTLITGCAMFKHKDKPCVTTVVKNPETIKTASGLQFKLTTKGCGVKAENGDNVKVHYTGKLTNDTVFDSSIPRGEPIEFKLGAHRVIKGWDEGIALMHVGDKALLTIPADLGYGARGQGKIPPNSTLIFEVELVSLTEGLKPWNAKGKDTLTTTSGLKVVFLSDTKLPDFVSTNTANMPVAGNKVKVHYSGFLLDGSMFDSSVERGQPFEFSLGQGMVIKGWDEGIALLHKGEKAKLIVPYQLAYGERGHPPQIPAKATLVFDVELVDFTK
ncbi:MAG TPA: FKBP-type peptidyl-prolyl cis-trans isomerase [Bacteroidia bacterium]|jgi:peptidylprolyl isomerase|nr:FKBP-type peptidyl-prolyl cis-trans isomerase [Bacteroidia bacterium]